jgi:hypothetical protein
MFSYSLAATASEAGFVIATDRFVCLVGRGGTAESCAQLYSLLHATQATLPDVLDVFSVLPAISNVAVAELIDARERTVHVAVRGAIEVELDQASTTRLGAVTESAWMTTQVRGVRALRLSMGDVSTPTPMLPLRDGVAVASAAALTTRNDQTTLSSTPTDARETPAADSVDRGVATAVAGEPSLATMPIAIPRVAEIMGEPYRANSSARATRVALPARWFVQLADGSEVEVRQPVVVGRRPWHGQTESIEVVHIVAASPRREISSDHLEFAVVEGSLECRDLNSTNGTVVRSSERAPWLLERGRSAILSQGDILDLGESFTIRVESRS